MAQHRIFTAASFVCTEPRCCGSFKSSTGLWHHRDTVHLTRPRVPALHLPDGPQQEQEDKFVPPPPSPGPDPPPSPPPQETILPDHRDVHLAIRTATICLPIRFLCHGKNAPLMTFPLSKAVQNSSSRNFCTGMRRWGSKRIDCLSQLLAALYQEADPLFADHKDLYATIDAIQQGDVPWQSFTVTYMGPLPESGEVPVWMTEKYEVWFRSPLGIFEKQIANPDFKDEMDWAPKRIFKDGKCQYVDLFSGNWDKIAKDENTHGAMFVPSVLGSDKTTVSVSTGNTEFYLLYGGIATHNHSGSTAFRKFCRQLFHSSLHKILSPLKPHMTVPRVTRCGDGHFRRIILSKHFSHVLSKTGVLMANLDFPSVCRSHEHTDALMEGCTLKELWDDFGLVGDLIPFTTGFPRADIHELISMDLLHQVIKGTFKDHVVDWVETYIRTNHEKPEADRILADIDRRIAVTPSFPGLRHFHVSRGYKQWTGNDSKGLMKVYLPAIAGHVPSEVVRGVADIIEFCHLIRHSVIDEDTLVAIDAAVARFHLHCEAFRANVRPEGFSLPRQHSIVHYRSLIQMFGSPNGLCSSITESKHIKAVKKPYRCTNHNKPLGQMLLTNQCLDKLAAARIDFTAHGMLDGALLPSLPLPPCDPSSDPPDNPDDEHVDNGAVEGPTCIGEVKLAKTYVRRVPRDVHELALYMEQPCLHELIHRFLFDQLNPNAPIPGG
ncbi:hypothetical protein B0H10DRAFT_1944422 [Mycena sp. CBHHK59/15]|nr:hypothetical protein B0H10DRAFT_1944422 [Mycena sp. CBHHK59/15]